MIELEPLAETTGAGLQPWHVVAVIGGFIAFFILTWPIRRWARSLRRREMGTLERAMWAQHGVFPSKRIFGRYRIGSHRPGRGLAHSNTGGRVPRRFG